MTHERRQPLDTASHHTLFLALLPYAPWLTNVYSPFSIIHVQTLPSNYSVQVLKYTISINPSLPALPLPPLICYIENMHNAPKPQF